MQTLPPNQRTYAIQGPLNPACFRISDSHCQFQFDTDISLKGLAFDSVKHGHPTSRILITMDSHFSTFGRLIVALILAVLAQADYIMDDSNNTIQYGGLERWQNEDNLQNYGLNYSNVFNGTL
jgi:hypothetical protein